MKLVFETFHEVYSADFFDYFVRPRAAWKSEKRYDELRKNIEALYNQNSNVRDIVDLDKPCELSAEDCDVLVNILKYKNEMSGIEMQEAYFKGCMDCVGYLKKLNIL